MMGSDYVCIKGVALILLNIGIKLLKGRHQRRSRFWNSPSNKYPDILGDIKKLLEYLEMFRAFFAVLPPFS